METVQKIYSLGDETYGTGAFSALLSDGSVTCWGDTAGGNPPGDCSGVDFDGASNMETVEKIYNTMYAFSAKLSDGTVECWGGNVSGGDCSAVDFDGASNMAFPQKIMGTRNAFSALLSDGTVNCWGVSAGGGDCSGVDFDGASNSETVQALYSNTGDNSYYYGTSGSFSALLTDGSVVCWGEATDGGDCSGIDFDGADDAQTVTSIYSSDTNMAAILSDGSAVCWGTLSTGNDCSSIDLQGESIVNSYKFASGVVIETSGNRLIPLGTELNAFSTIFVTAPLTSVISASKTSKDTLSVEYLGGINITYYVGNQNLGSFLGRYGIAPEN